MRIIGGVHRGRKLTAPPGGDVRPTTDRVRESLFNMLAHGSFLPQGIEGLRVLDLFAGSGALGLEALSRGAAFACFVEKDSAARACLERNVKALGAAAETIILRHDAARLPMTAEQPFHLVFLDPPYAQGLGEPALAALLKGGWLSDGAHVVYEMARGEDLPDAPGFAISQERLYGAAKIVFLTRASR